VPAEFIDLYERHLDDVYGFLVYRTRRAPEAEELTQETFARALSGWRTFDPTRGSSRAWLLTIARNVYIDFRRRSAVRPGLEASVEPDGIIGEPEPAIRVELDPEVAAAMNKLSRREREAVALRFGGDLRAAEIGSVLGISTSNAQQVLSRALRRLRSILSEPMDSRGAERSEDDHR
jgi:RNA polymerase sigma-70 factor, ECF subfamily